MTPQYVVDTLIRRPDHPNDLSPPTVRGLLFALLHGWFRRHPGQYAVALLPDCLGLRIFASTERALTELLSALTAREWVQDALRITPVRAVPADFQGPWLSVRRFRIPTLSADRHTDHRHGALRTRRLETVTKEGMEQIYVRSASTRQGFTLCIQQVPGHPQPTDCHPNSYGLATTQNAFAVPDLPLPPEVLDILAEETDHETTAPY